MQCGFLDQEVTGQVITIDDNESTTLNKESITGVSYAVSVSGVGLGVVGNRDNLASGSQPKYSGNQASRNSNAPTEEEYIVKSLIQMTELLAQFDISWNPDLIRMTTNVEFINDENEEEDNVVAGEGVRENNGVAGDGQNNDATQPPKLSIADNIEILPLEQLMQDNVEEDNVVFHKDDDNNNNDSVLLRNLRNELEYLEDTRNGRLDNKIDEEQDKRNKQKSQSNKGNIVGSIVSKQSLGVASRTSADGGKGKGSQGKSGSRTKMAWQSTLKLAKPSEKKRTTTPKRKAKRKASQQCQRSSPRLEKTTKKKQCVLDDSEFVDSDVTE